MTTGIDEMLIDQLVAIGVAGVPRVPPFLGGRNDSWDIMMCGDSSWRVAAESLSDTRLAALIKGLVLYSHATGWNGGSVSPVITLHEELMRRGDYSDVTRWIVENRRNAHEPFRTTIHGNAKTVREFEEFRKRRDVDSDRRRAHEELRQREEGTAKRAREASAVTERLVKAVRRGDVNAVRVLLAKGADWRRALPEGESLVDLARQNGREEMVELLVSQGIS